MGLSTDGFDLVVANVAGMVGTDQYEERARLIGGDQTGGYTDWESFLTTAITL